MVKYHLINYLVFIITGRVFFYSIRKHVRITNLEHFGVRELTLMFLESAY